LAAAASAHPKPGTGRAAEDGDEAAGIIWQAAVVNNSKEGSI
jgi:hypothetical protein